MEVERVQRWVASALVLTVATLFATGLAILSGTVDRAGARPGLLGISCVVGLMAMAGVRVINGKRVLTAWLVLGLLPAAVVGSYYWLQS
jgi:MFS-type transporter involved in bile tolerance (Atg22 family)